MTDGAATNGGPERTGGGGKHSAVTIADPDATHHLDDAFAELDRQIDARALEVEGVHGL